MNILNFKITKEADGKQEIRDYLEEIRSELSINSHIKITAANENIISLTEIKDIFSDHICTWDISEGLNIDDSIVNYFDKKDYLPVWLVIAAGESNYIVVRPNEIKGAINSKELTQKANEIASIILRIQ